MRTVINAYTLSECMETLCEYVSAYEQQGEENLIFCEDRLTLIAERSITKALGGTFKTNVSTFSRYAPTSKSIITKQGSVMIIADVMSRLQKENALQCFTHTFSVGSYAKSIYETIAQFSASEITPEILEHSANQLPDDIFKKKTLDLAKIYSGYIEFLSSRNFLDESRYLSLLPDTIRQKKNLAHTNVFFVCHTAFTLQALQTVRAVLETAKNVIGIFCAGEEELYTNSAFQSFKRVCEEYGKTTVLNKGKPLFGEAEAIRLGLFNPERTNKPRVVTDKVRFFEGEDKRREGEYVAVQIRKTMAKTNGLHYRDFAVLVSSVENYTLALKRAFNEYEIPYFIDEKRSLKNHPISRLLLDSLQVVKDKFSAPTVDALLSNIFFGDCDEYRNYLLKFGNYRGGAKREIKVSEAVAQRFDIEKIKADRERLLLATKNIRLKDNGYNYCKAMRQILKDFDTTSKLLQLQENLTDIAHKSFLSQIDKTLDALLTEAESLIGNRQLTVTDFYILLSDGLNATEISLIPLKADAVFIGDIQDSRIEKIHTLFCVGLTDEVPLNASDSAIITDREIAKLQEVKTLLEPTIAQVNLRARESVCLNICTFLEGLYLTYPLPSGGKQGTKSEIYRYVNNVLCNSDGQDIPMQKDFSNDDFVYRCGRPSPAIKQLLLEKFKYEKTGEDDRRTYSSLFTALDKLGVQDKDDYLAEREKQVCVERADELFFHDGKVSPTGLEGYFCCPFKNFISQGIRATEREETPLLALDTGNFIHKILEETAKNVAQFSNENEAYQFALNYGRKLYQDPLYATQLDVSSGTYSLEKLVQEGASIAVGIYNQIVNSTFKVEKTEKTVQTDLLNGKIDRVDSNDNYIRIIDYKTGRIDDKPTPYYTGQKLQLELYMSAVKGKKIPAGVFYFPASISYQDSDEGRFKMQGFINGDKEALLSGDKNLSGEKASDYFNASLDGKNGQSVMDSQTFNDFIDYSKYIAKQGYDEIKEGFIAPSPYKGTCRYCKYGGICGFRKDKQAIRNEKAIKPSEIAAIVQKIREEKGE